MNRYISMILKVLIFAILMALVDSIESIWYYIPFIIVCGWFGWMIAENDDNKMRIKNQNENIIKGLMKFQCWDKEKKKFWSDFRIHPQGIIAPAIAEKDGYWIYDWDYDQSKLELYTTLENIKSLNNFKDK